MRIEILFGEEKAEFDLLDGVIHVGGLETDAIHLPGLPGALLTLNLVGERLMVTASRAVSIGGVRFPAHMPRLVIAGERLVLPSGIVLRQIPGNQVQQRSFKGTACVVKELVGDGFSLSASRTATLTCLTGLDAGCSFPVALRETVIGRGEQCAVRVRDRAVSRRHARVVRQRSSDFLEAIPDTRGLFLNGEPVIDATLLRPGDVIELGQSLLRYDGPELALKSDDKLEPTVLLPADEPEPTEPDPAPPFEESLAPAPPQVHVPPSARPKIPVELVLLGTGTMLALIGLAATLSACL